MPQKWKTGIRVRSRIKCLVLNLRSRCKHKAWGVSPREVGFLEKSPRERAKEVAKIKGCRPLSRAGIVMRNVLGLTPQALCLHLLRRLRQPPIFTRLLRSSVLRFLRQSPPTISVRKVLMNTPSCRWGIRLDLPDKLDLIDVLQWLHFGN